MRKLEEYKSIIAELKAQKSEIEGKLSDINSQLASFSVAAFELAHGLDNTVTMKSGDGYFAKYHSCNYVNGRCLINVRRIKKDGTLGIVIDGWRYKKVTN